MTTLIVARHGNTFNAGETPRRVGARTDLPLTSGGREQAIKIGQYFRRNNLLPDIAYVSPLRRTRETCELALLESGSNCEVHTADFLKEIDYGPDENKTEDEVIGRIGRRAIEDWNESAKVPPDWSVDPDAIIAAWKSFANALALDTGHKTVLAVTSNGIARFLPHILGTEAFDNFLASYKLKISTGALCLFSYDGSDWNLKDWNLKP